MSVGNLFKYITITVLVVMISVAIATNYISSMAASSKEDYAAKQLKEVDILRGDENGNLLLDAHITRAEMATLILRIMMYEDEPVADAGLSKHTDIKGHWAESNIKKVINLKYMKGKSDAIFGPNDQLTYGEIVTLIIRLMGAENASMVNWPVDYVNKAKELKIIKDETVWEEVKYNNSVTRGMVALMLWDTITANTNVR